MARLLDGIDSPADLKKIPVEQLPTLAQEIRETLIQTLAKTGGHLGPNLGVVELSIALHYVFNTPEDNFTFDVSHQAYVHKLLTGRRKDFHTMRQPGGLNGFMLRTESTHDCYGAGHAGTALSAALGMAVARDCRGSDENVVALCGDAAFTCGVTIEALNNAAHSTKKLIVILNDNEWSIDRNVGAVAHYLNKITTSESFSHLHEKAGQFLEMIGGTAAVDVARKVEEGVKGLMFPSVIFEELGCKYYGPVDGHDVDSLIKTLDFLKQHDGVHLLHVLTQKSRGFTPAMEKQKAFHGTGPYHPETGEGVKKAAGPTYSQIFADTLIDFAETNQKLVAITAGMPNGTGLDRFQSKFKDRYYDVGIAEEHAVLFAAGMATKGFKPICGIYSTFLQRAFDMVIHDVCLQNLPVVFCMDRGGISGDDGPTHHGLFDISYMRCVPNMVHMSPKDEPEFQNMLFTAMHHPGPISIRYPRGGGPGTELRSDGDYELIPVGKAEVIRHGKQIAIWAYGKMNELGLELADELTAQGYSVAVINARFAKPIDSGTLEFFGRSAELIFTLEDHVITGGFGSAVLESMNDLDIDCPVVRVGWPDDFVEHGKEPALREKYGLTVKGAVEQAQPFLSKIKPEGDDKSAEAAPAVA